MEQSKIVDTTETYHYDAVWSGHLELEISIVWHCVESSKRSLSEQCMIAAAEWDDIED